MKNARPTIEAETSEPLGGGSILAGRLPKRLDTLNAEVLMQLLSGAKLTGIEAVFDAGTTRLAGAVHYLAKQYGWPVFTKEKAHGCKDGRLEEISVYYLLPSTIAEAMKAGAAVWSSDVRRARAKRRATAHEAARIAQARNAARKHRTDPGQGDLFGGATA